MEFDKNAQVESYYEKYTFHGDPRPSLWRWRAQAGRSRGKFDRTLRQRKRTSKLLSSKNFLSKAKKRGASRNVHA